MAPWTEHRRVQQIARNVLEAIAASICPDDTERSIADRAVAELARRGIDETWYHQCPALVLLGTRSCLSLSGRDYTPADEPVGDFNLVTVDLSPSDRGVWGDLARSFYIEDGKATAAPASAEFREGADVLAALHRAVVEFATPDRTLHELFEFGNGEIARHGFRNLDFLENLGHSIVSRPDDRVYLERGNRRRLGNLSLFTFEPHIRKGLPTELAGGEWGFKHEEIYRFNDSGRLEPL